MAGDVASTEEEQREVEYQRYQHRQPDDGVLQSQTLRYVLRANPTPVLLNLSELWRDVTGDSVYAYRCGCFERLFRVVMLHNANDDGEYAKQKGKGNRHPWDDSASHPSFKPQGGPSMNCHTLPHVQLATFTKVVNRRINKQE